MAFAVEEYGEVKKMRLIDADALCRKISLHIMAYKELLTNKITIPSQIDKEKINSIIDGFRECIDIVYYEPTVNAEPVIRCEDCKYFKFGNGCILQSIDYDWEEQMYANDFCSRGVKK